MTNTKKLLTVLVALPWVAAMSVACTAAVAAGLVMRLISTMTPRDPESL